MKRGDLVLYENQHYIVSYLDAHRLHVARLLGVKGTVEVPHDLDKDPEKLRVLCNPPEDWPFITAPEKPRWGPIVDLFVVSQQSRTPIKPFQDWIVTEPLRCGGSIFLRPDLLRLGDMVQVSYSKGMVNVTVPPSFGTIAMRKARAEKKPKQEATPFDRLLSDDEDFG